MILAGGLGTRLQPYTFFLPKPMLPLGDKPVLEHIIEWLKSQGVRDIVISVSYFRRVIEEYFGDGSEFGVRIQYARSNKPLGTAGQLKAAQHMINDRFITIYGDVLVRAEIKPMLDYHVEKKALATMMLMEHKVRLRYGIIETNEEGRVVSWREKPEVGGWVNVGCYIMEPRFLEYIPGGRVYGMDLAFNEAVKAGEPVYAFKARGTFIDIGDKRSYVEANRMFIASMGRIP